MRYRRREFNPTPEQPEARTLAHLDTFPLARRCDSCDRRLAVVTKQSQNQRLCEPCARKAIVGQLQRTEDTNRKWFDDAHFSWQPPTEKALESWETKFNKFICLRHCSPTSKDNYTTISGMPNRPAK